MVNALPLSDYRPRTKLEVRRTHVERPRFPVVDAHNHVYFNGQWSSPEPDALLRVMDEAGVRVLACVDAAGPDDPLSVVRDTVRRFKGPHPDRFIVLARPDWRLLAGSSASLARRFADCVAEGAQGLKLWKDLGLTLRDGTGNLVRVNDPRLDPLISKAGELGLPVLVHAADPVAFFDPLDATNERYEELLAHPDWHFHGSQFPPFRGIIEDLRDLVRRHPKTIFIGAHVGGYAEKLDYVGGMLRECPNYYVDMSGRVAELGHTIGEELLKVHLSYGPLVQALLRRFNPPSVAVTRQSTADTLQGSRQGAGVTPPRVVKGLAHITGGGFVDNIPRILPKQCDVVIRKGTWDVLPIFRIIAAKGGVAEAELYQVFNMGIGMVLIVAADRAAAVLAAIHRRKHHAWIIGEVVRGQGRARIQ